MYRCGVFKQNRLEYVISRFWNIGFLLPLKETAKHIRYVTNLQETKVFKWEIPIRTVVSEKFQSTILWKTSCFSKKNEKKKKKKDRDPTISAVTNIHTRFFIQIREYPSTRILAAALISFYNKSPRFTGTTLVYFLIDFTQIYKR